MKSETTLPTENVVGVASHDLFGVRVRYASDVLGEGFLHHERNDPSDVFPKGHLTRIFNLPARRMANATVEDGKERRYGMWEVTPVFHALNDERTHGARKEGL
jgi:hypothetical protein